MLNNEDSKPVLPAKLSIAIAMFAMMTFGYLLAQYFSDEQSREIAAVNHTVESFVQENDRLITENHQLQAQLILQRDKNDQLKATLNKYQLEQNELLNIVSLYERIIAPETTQEGFLVEQMSVADAASKGYYRISFILLQQRQNRAVIKGNLNINIAGSQADQPMTINTGSEYLLPDGAMFYRFKFFQSESFEFTLPDGFTPEFIDVETDVYQYTTLRGKYEKRFAWAAVYDK